jgi:hypothetical protein
LILEPIFLNISKNLSCILPISERLPLLVPPLPALSSRAGRYRLLKWTKKKKNQDIKNSWGRKRAKGMRGEKVSHISSHRCLSGMVQCTKVIKKKNLQDLKPVPMGVFFKKKNTTIVNPRRTNKNKIA